MALVDAGLLRQIPLFSLLDDAELHALAPQLDESEFLAGQIIFRAGEPGGKMYIVRTGEVEVFLKEDGSTEYITLSHVKAGDIFGEFSLLDNEPRSANARAMINTAVLVVDQDDLHYLIQNHPAAALDMMAMLTRRIRESNVRVQERSIRNVNEELPISTSLGDRLADLLTRGASNIKFTYFSFVWFAAWIMINLHLIPGVAPFDPYPFGFLTMVVSLEAIFLSLFVLISQERQTARDKVRNDIEYEINIRAEVEIRALADQVENLQQIMIQHLADIKTDARGSGRKKKAG